MTCPTFGGTRIKQICTDLISFHLNLAAMESFLYLDGFHNTKILHVQ
jgi:hypothetical protein